MKYRIHMGPNGEIIQVPYSDVEKTIRLESQVIRPELSPLWYGGSGEMKVPLNIAKCPKCEGSLSVAPANWCEETGAPRLDRLFIGCQSRECDYGKTSDSSIIDSVAKWCGAK